MANTAGQRRALIDCYGRHQKAEQSDEEGRIYYHHKKSGRALWDMPDGFQEGASGSTL